jgi:transposase
MLGSARDRAAVWGERLRRYERSGLTVAAFCQREGVSVPSFYQWRRRLTETSGRQAKAAPRLAASPAFQPVLLSGGGIVNIELPSGVRLELPAQQVQLVRAVMAELLLAESASRQGDA